METIKSYVTKQTLLGMKSLSFFYIITKSKEKVENVICYDREGILHDITALEPFENPKELIEFRLGLQAFKKLCER
jgi:uncharacterized protein YjhX (UPF0386 family)